MTTYLYQQFGFPVFQNRMYDSAKDARECQRGDIFLVQDKDSGLVQNAAFRPELLDYDSAYQNEQGHSSVFKEHLEAVTRIVERSIGKQGLIEVGCGKAYFLELLQQQGFSVTGFDPTYEGDNPAVQRHYFGAGVTMTGRGLILRHVLEHVQDPVGFLEGLRDANGGGGLIYIEVPCLDWILRKRAWFDIFYEHVNYFRIGDFFRMFGRVTESGSLFNGQYLYVVADLATVRRPHSGSDVIRFPDNMLDEVVPRASEPGSSPVTVWGAASKGVIYALLSERVGTPVEVLIDINPAKCGRYVPATGLRVSSPEEGIAMLAPGSEILVMNSNYLQEIREMTNDQFRLIGLDSLPIA